MQRISEKCREIQINAENWREKQRISEKCREMQFNAEKLREIQRNTDMQRYPHDLHDLYSDKIREMQRDVKKNIQK